MEVCFVRTCTCPRARLSRRHRRAGPDRVQLRQEGRGHQEVRERQRRQAGEPARSVAGRDQVQGCPDDGHRPVLRPDRVHQVRRRFPGLRHRLGERDRQDPRRQGRHQEGPVRRDSRRHQRRPLRLLHVGVHRQRRPREGQRLRHLLHGRHLDRGEEGQPEEDSEPERPVRAAGGRRERHHPGHRADREHRRRGDHAQGSVPQGRQEGARPGAAARPGRGECRGRRRSCRRVHR